MATDTKRINVEMDVDLHRDLKIEVAKQGTTIGAFVVEAIKEKIEKERGK